MLRLVGADWVGGGDYYKEDSTLWMDFEEKGAQSHSLPVLGELKSFRDSYIVAGDNTCKDAWLFQSVNRNGGLSGKQYDRGNSILNV